MQGPDISDAEARVIVALIITGGIAVLGLVAFAAWWLGTHVQWVP